jgi:hypothetical protein
MILPKSPIPGPIISNKCDDIQVPTSLNTCQQISSLQITQVQREKVQSNIPQTARGYIMAAQLTNTRSKWDNFLNRLFY